MLREVGIRMMSPNYSLPHVSEKRTYKLLYPVRRAGSTADDTYRWFPYPGEHGESAAAERVMEEIVRHLEVYLGCKRQVFNLDELWQQTRPVGQPHSLDEATGWVSLYKTLKAVQLFSLKSMSFSSLHSS